MAVSPPRVKDMPLSALRAFEAAARLGSFAAAATELGVTPGAVTAHIKALEAVLGAALFQRTARGVVLSPVSQRALPQFSTAFDALAAAVQTLRAEAAPKVVHIATLPAIAQLWLSPRLPTLRVASPDIQISITAVEEPPNLKRSPYDLSLFYGDTGSLIAPVIIFPVCSPLVAQRLASPETLSGVPCLTDATWAQDWGIWSKGAMPGQTFVPRGPVFSLYALAVEEAAGGAGVLMGHEALVATHLAAGLLVAPFAHRQTLTHSMRLWSARPMRAGSAVARVAEFLQSAGRRDQENAAVNAISTMSPKLV